MFKYYKSILSVWIFLIVSSSCTEDKLEPLEDDGQGPAALIEPGVENLPGAAMITYTIPDDVDLLYVKAEVEAQPDVVRVTKASMFKNQLLLECFAESKAYEVKLYAVDRGENESKPVKVTVHPLKLPIQTVFESLTMEADFGGVKVSYNNETEANIAIVVSAQDAETGEWVVKDTYYTKTKEGYFSARGFDPVETNFRLFVKDKCDNRSGSGDFTATPLFEEPIPKPFYTYNLPTDTYEAHAQPTWTIERLWDESVSSDNHLFHTKPGSVFPIQCTFDLGVTAVLSRFKMWGRLNAAYNVGNIKEFEIWGTAATPAPDGSWEGWNKLLDGESIKPSGLPVGTNTAEDLAVYEAGEEYSFPLGLSPVRYIRFKTESTWGGVSYTTIKEMSFWGQIE